MKTRTIVSGLVVVLVGAIAHAGEIPANQAGLWFCQSIQPDPTAPLYASDVFDGNFDGSAMKNAFQRMLTAKHGITSQVSCSMAYDTPGIREKLAADHQRWFAQIRSGGGTVVETHWTFAPASERFAYQCRGGAEHMQGSARTSTYLYTDTIEMSGSDADKLGIAWNAYLANLHPGWFFPDKGCTRLPDDPTQRQAVVDDAAQRWKAMKAEMIRVNWTYAPVQASADDNVPSVFCQALRSDNKDWYVTPVFAAATAAEGTAAMNAWRTYLKGIKDPDGYVVADSYLSGCDGPGPAKAMKQQRAARDEQIRNGGGRVVEMSWTFNGATTVATASPAAAPTEGGATTATAPVGNGASAATAQATAATGSSAAAQFYQCSMGSFGGNYLTPGFSSTKDANVIKADWQAHMKQAHPVQGVVHANCMTTTPKAAAAGLAGPGFSREDWSD